MFGEIIRFFARHRTAANLLMVLMIAIGGLSAARLNKQFFPDVDIEIVAVSVEWSGATAEDVDANIVRTLEPELRTLANVKTVASTSFEGLARINVEFEFGADMQKALADVEAAVGRVRLPVEAKAPNIIKGEFYDVITRATLYGSLDLEALRWHAKGIKEDLLQRGADRVQIIGLPEPEILIEVAEADLTRLGLSLTDIQAAIAAAAVDVPAGRFADGALRVRSLGKRETAAEFADIEILVRPDGSSVRLGEVAQLTDSYAEPALLLSHRGQPAVELLIERGKTSDSLATHKVVQAYLDEKAEKLPAGLSLTQHEVAALLILDRIMLMVKNGLGGLVLVCLVLFLFLPGRVAFWVAVGIPVAFLATFGVMLVSGQSINMISLFGLIMALGIVVDDAIVIGEHAEHLRERRKLPIEEAAVLAAARMGPPVVSAMLTTVAAFLPLFIIKGIIGVIIAAIPAVVCAVLVASLIECFFILPAHLSHSGIGKQGYKVSAFRRGFDNGFGFLRDRLFAPAVRAAFRFRYVTLAFAFGLLIFSVGMIAGGRVPFVFFSSPEADRLYANVVMASGSTRQQTEKMVAEMERALDVVHDEMTDGRRDLLVFAYSQIGRNIGAGDTGEAVSKADDLRAGLLVELVTADQRQIRSADFVDALRAEIRPLPGLERLLVRAPEGGPPGRDLDLRVMGDNLAQLKRVAGEMVQLIDAIPGTSDLEENLNYGAEERIIRLTPLGRSLGFSVSSVGAQLRAALDGAVVQRFARADDEVTVRLTRPDSELSDDRLGSLRLITRTGSFVDLAEIATIEQRLGFSVVRRKDGFREVAVQGELDENVINTAQLTEILQAGELPGRLAGEGLRYRFDGRDQEQGEAFADMQTGAILALLSIYVILAWVFSSWMRPFAVMIMIPFGLIGAVFGHFVMGLSLSILSMFALIALAGIVVNNSIILVATIDRRLADLGGGDEHLEEAIVQGAADRLRPVLLTSMTTIGGLSTLMFETSLQAQFLIPMAATITFGLGVTTCLVLFVVPATLGAGRDIGQLAAGLFRLISRPFIWLFSIGSRAG